MLISLFHCVYYDISPVTIVGTFGIFKYYSTFHYI